MSDEESLNLASGLAALSISESLIICLVEKGILDAMDFETILETARDAHERCTPQNFTRQDHDRAAAIITQIIAGANSVRGTSLL
jgi:hypothetical protein